MDYCVSQQLSELFQENAGNTLGEEIARRAANGAANGAALKGHGQASTDPAAVLGDLKPEAIPLVPLGGSYGGHFKKRASVSGEYQGTSGVTYRFMQPSKYAAQHDFFSAAVKHSGFSD